MPYIDINREVATLELVCQWDTCRRKINETQAYVKCDQCQSIFHLHCQNILGSNIARVKQARVWQCLQCSKDLSDDKLQSLESIIAKNHQSLVTLITDVQQSQQFISNKFDEIEKEYKRIQRENEQLKTEIKEIKLKYAEQSVIIAQMEADFDSIKQHEIMTDVIISGLPKVAEGEKMEVLEAVFGALNLGTTVSKADVKDIKIIQQKTGTSSLMIVKFMDIEMKKKVMEKRRIKKSLTIRETGLGTKPTEHQIYLRDSLTAYKRQLFRDTKDVQTKLNFEYGWIKDGRIFLRKESGSKPYVINSRLDLQKVEKIFQTVDGFQQKQKV